MIGFSSSKFIENHINAFTNALREANAITDDLIVRGLLLILELEGINVDDIEIESQEITDSTCKQIEEIK